MHYCLWRHSHDNLLLFHPPTYTCRLVMVECFLRSNNVHLRRSRNDFRRCRRSALRISRVRNSDYQFSLGSSRNNLCNRHVCNVEHWLHTHVLTPSTLCWTSNLPAVKLFSLPSSQKCATPANSRKSSSQ